MSLSSTPIQAILHFNIATYWMGMETSTVMFGAATKYVVNPKPERVEAKIEEVEKDAKIIGCWD